MPDLTDMGIDSRLSGEESCARLAAGALASPRPFQLAGDTPHYARDLTVDVRHIKLEIRIEPQQKWVGGTAAHFLSAINDGVQRIEFDAAEMDISGVSLDGKAVQYSYHDPVLVVSFSKPLQGGVEHEVAITYSAHPRRGLYFTAPDSDYPDKPLQAWTQGQDEDSRHWYPCIDFPNHQQTSEVIVTVPASMISIGNGELRRVTEDRRGGTRTYHWYQEIPHVTYLLSQIVGDFAEIVHHWEGIPLQYYGPHGREDDLQRTLERTPQMMAFFSDVTGVKYPYAKYAQTFVADFIFGGMENISATTLTETSLLDKRASLDADSDGLLAHELAHQWFGDLLTCRDWSHGWLNEGFATYFEALFTEHNKGIDEFRYELYQNTQIYMGEDANRYRRPIVHNVYHEPIDLFDRHLYEKGSLVLHMIRTVLGELWWKAIRQYVNEYRNRNVTTPEFQRAIERATGRNIDWLFDQYVYRGGHPAFRLAFEWNDEAKQAKLNVTQTQDEKQSSVFRMPVWVAFTVDGKDQRFQVEISEKVHNFYFTLSARPQMVRFDDGNNWLKTVEFKRGKEMLLHQLKHDDDVIGRIDAAKELGKLATPEAIEALREAVLKDKFWGVQAEAARALGLIRTTAARDALQGCLKVKHPKARRGVVGALGQFRHDEEAARALEQVVRKGDPSYYVEAAAAQALGHTRSPQAFDVLATVAMTRESQNDVIRASALNGFAELKDERALPIAVEWTRHGKSNPVRGVATLVLGRLGQLSDRAKDQAYDRLVELLPDEWLRVRLNAISALAELKDTRAVAELERQRARDLDGRVVRSAREAVRRIREGADKGEEVRHLREDFDRLQEENRSLKDRLDKLEASVNGAKPAPAAKKAAKRPARKTAVKRPARRAAAARTRR